VRAGRRPLVDPFGEKIDELVDRSRAQIRADKAHAILVVAMGMRGRIARRGGRSLRPSAGLHVGERLPDRWLGAG
jgi:hypothetical protein